MQRGRRYINGKCYELAGRVKGWDAQKVAQDEANAIRKRQCLVRLIKVSDSHYMIYSFGPGDSPKKQ